MVEITHEALLQGWPRLRRWIERDREALLAHRRLTEASREWERSGRDEGLLYRGTRLAAWRPSAERATRSRRARLTETVEWRARRNQDLNQLEREFLDASNARLRGERAARRRRRGLAFSAVTAAIVAMIGVGLTLFFAARERDIAASRDLATKSASLIVSDPMLGQAVALEALSRHRTAQAENAVRQAAYLHRGTAAAQAHDGIVNNLAVSRDGQQLGTAGEDGRVRVWSLDDLRPGATVADYPSRAMAASFSPDGAQIASVSSDGKVVLAPVRGGPGEELMRLPHGDFARSVEFNRHGTSLLIATDAGAVGLIRLGGARPSYRVLGRHQQRARAHFDPDGTHAVSASDDGSARIWTLGGGHSVPLAHPGAVVDAAFSPDGRQVATAGDDGVARIWDAADGRLVKQIHVDDGVLMSVHYSPDGRRLVVPGDDGVLHIADVRGGIVVAEIRGHAGAVYDAAFVRDGRALISVGQDGTLRGWAPPEASALPVGGADDAPVAISFSPDASGVVAGYGTGAVRVFDLATGASIALPSHGDWATANYSPDGAFIASASYDATVRLWDVKRRTSRLVPTSEAPKIAVAVAPGGKQVATDGEEEDPMLAAPDGSHRVTLRGHRGEVTTLVFSPDGKHLMSASEDKTIRIWSTADGSLERILRGHDKAIINAAFSRDGQRIASTDTDGAVRIWSASGAAARRALRPRGAGQLRRVRPQRRPAGHDWERRHDPRLEHRRGAAGRSPAARGHRPQRQLQRRRQAGAERGRGGRGAVVWVRSLRLVRRRARRSAVTAAAQAERLRPGAAALGRRLSAYLGCLTGGGLTPPDVVLASSKPTSKAAFSASVPVVPSFFSTCAWRRTHTTLFPSARVVPGIEATTSSLSTSTQRSYHGSNTRQYRPSSLSGSET